MFISCQWILIVALCQLFVCFFFSFVIYWWLSLTTWTCIKLTGFIEIFGQQSNNYCKWNSVNMVNLEQIDNGQSSTELIVISSIAKSTFVMTVLCFDKHSTNKQKIILKKMQQKYQIESTYTTNSVDMNSRFTLYVRISL